MRAHRITELLERTLVIVAHPDDECIGAAALLQRIADPAVIFCTDGGPRDSYFWQSHGSREEYVRVRRLEAASAAQTAGLTRQVFLPIIDQELHLNLRYTYQELEQITLEFRPHAILTLAYEGGHPDHDCCAFLSHLIGVQQGIEVWEMPLYHRTSEGVRQQQFLHADTGSHPLRITSLELARKQWMVAAYASQRGVLGGFNLDMELFRPQPKYDFLQPPSAKVINYEAWKWPATARDLCNAFRALIPGMGIPDSRISRRSLIS